MKKALVIHPMLSFYAGGEYLCFNVCEALQELGYRVSLASQSFDPSELDRIYGLGRVMRECHWISIPRFRSLIPHLAGPQRLAYTRRVCLMFQETDADLIFSTQSSPFIVPRTMYHFVYNVGDLFGYPQAAAPLENPDPSNHLRRIYFASLRVARHYLLDRRAAFQNWFFAVGSGVLKDLKSKGYHNSSLAFPPSRVTFKPRFPKKKQVVQVARMIPDKRLDWFLEIAARVPDYEFFLVGRNDQHLEKLYPGYAKSILANLPRNVTYVNALVKERPEILEDSEIYLYTGIERGIGLAVIEAMSAGCIPFSPAGVGAVDIINTAGVGEIYESIEEAASKITMTFERASDSINFNAISRQAERFGPEAFKRWVKDVVDRIHDNQFRA